ncbi:MAG TPA: DUF488 domain-containing protein [Acidimicrobiales bacterium]|nr:DUF488 domain-containing protein [Acidimicrobiales bacterium]
MNPPRLTTVGHGTLEAEQFAALVVGAGLEDVVDVRSFPGSRRHPQFGRAQMEQWLPAAGVGYGWAQALGGFRKPRPDSPNVALRHAGFRGYADHMRTGEFRAALDRVVTAAGGREVAVMCSEGLWWRCHRRLLADAVVMAYGAEVRHLLHNGRLEAHRVTDGARPGDDGLPVYDAGVLL